MGVDPYAIISGSKTCKDLANKKKSAIEKKCKEKEKYRNTCPDTCDLKCGDQKITGIWASIPIFLFFFTLLFDCTLFLICKVFTRFGTRNYCIRINITWGKSIVPGVHCSLFLPCFKIPFHTNYFHSINFSSCWNLGLRTYDHRYLGKFSYISLFRHTSF